MLAVNYSTVRNKLKYYCDKVTDENETVVVTRKDDKNVLLISLEQYNALLKAAGKPSSDMPTRLGDRPARGMINAKEPFGAIRAKVSVDYKGIKQKAEDYAKSVRRVLPVDKAVLFGSYAKETATESSDVNICFFLNDFAGKSHTDIISELTCAIVNKLTAEELASAIRPHPTYVEGISEAVEDLFGMAIHMAPKRK